MTPARKRNIRTSARHIKATADNLFAHKLGLLAVLEAVEELQRHIRDIAAEAAEEYAEERNRENSGR